jgi:hypothetical protein
MMKMKRLWFVLGAALFLGACGDDVIVIDGAGGEPPAPPQFLAASYSNFGVRVTWELSTQWNGEFFRVYSRRVSQSGFTAIADVTSCQDGLCEYTDTNINANTSYEYFVSAVDPDSGVETDSDDVIVVDVPSFSAPPVPGSLEVVALDNANFVHWDVGARAADDFSFYRVYAIETGDPLLLGETDSEGFLDLLASNGVTSRYAVSAVDQFGHESDRSGSAAGTPRPDFQGEVVIDFFDDAEESGFRFQEDDSLLPTVSGFDASRHFRLEVDQSGWWFVPGPEATIFPTGVFTSALKCGVASDATCEDWTTAPTIGYGAADVGITPEFTYMFRVIGDDGQVHYGSVRVALIGTDQDGNDLMVFDWSYQTQADNPQLAPAGVSPSG